MDFEKARRAMVEGQVRTADVTEPSIVAALSEVPRERFVAAADRPLAYLDRDLPLSDGAAGRAPRHLLAPMVFARLVQAAAIGPHDLVLDVGCGTGYSTAVLARIADSVVALEEDAALAAKAVETLGEIGVGNAAVVTGPLTAGWPAEGPYDVIILQGSVDGVPDSLLAQLKPGGRLVAVVGQGRSARAVVWLAGEGEVSRRPVFDAAAPPLPGFARAPAFVF